MSVTKDGVIKKPPPKIISEESDESEYEEEDDYDDEYDDEAETSATPSKSNYYKYIIIQIYSLK